MEPDSLQKAEAYVSSDYHDMGQNKPLLARVSQIAHCTCLKDVGNPAFAA